MKIYCVILFSVISLFNKVMAQASLSGIVAEKDQKPLANVNVFLYNLSDSLLLKVTITDSSGSYIIESITPGKYYIKVTSINFAERFSDIILVSNERQKIIDTLMLLPDAKVLKEIAVSAMRPFIEQKIDRTVVNVANSIIAAGSTALEILEKAPGITIDRQNDQIIFKGKEGAIVQIDGKQSYMPMSDVVSLLRSMPADNIDKIELITNPGAKYDAAGNAGIIDIRLKKNNNLGMNGSITGGIGTGRYLRERASTQVNYRTSRLNLFGNYSVLNNGSYWDFDIKRTQFDGSIKNVINSLSFIRFKDVGQNFKIGIDYFLNKRTTLGMVWTGLSNKSKENSPAHTLFQKQETDPVYLHTLSDKTLSNNSSNHLVNLNMQHAFNKNGSTITVDFDVARFKRAYSNSLKTQTLTPTTPQEIPTGLVTEMPSIIDIITLKTDYAQSLSASWKMEAGLKSSSVHSNNDVSLSSGLIGNIKKDTLLSNHFKYSELINAGYLNFSGALNKKSRLTLGLRVEHTHSVGNSLTLRDVVTRNYLNFFPSIYYLQKLDDQNTIAFSYSYRIDRPNYQSLNPARSYLDPYTYSSGNGSLKPQYTNSIELRHGFKEKIFTSIVASYVTDLQFYVLQPLDSIIARRMPENIGKAQSYSLTISFPAQVINGWNLQSSLMGNYGLFSYIYMNSPIRSQQLSGTLNISNMFIFGKGWTGELTGWLRTPSINALTKFPWLGSMDVGIQKSFNTRWKTKISLQDVLHTNKIVFRIDTPDFINNGAIVMDTRIIQLNLTYSFGNQQLKNSRQRRTAAEEETQRTN